MAILISFEVLFKTKNMKRLIILFITCISIFYFSGIAIAQEKAKTEITSVKQNGQTIEFIIASDKPFYVGGNIHILHIGSKDFTHSRQTKNNGKGTLTFLIPITDFNSLTEDDNVWISYGNLLKETPDEKTDIKAMCEKSPQKCWYLGKFSKQLLSK